MYVTDWDNVYWAANVLLATSNISNVAAFHNSAQAMLQTWCACPAALRGCTASRPAEHSSAAASSAQLPHALCCLPGQGHCIVCRCHGSDDRVQAGSAASTGR